ncbi:AB hydrolase superfamily protein [Abortiporus biennis]
MNPTQYKNTTVSRGFNYHYDYSSSKLDSTATVLFCHGFPSTSHDWRFSIAYFEKLRYGVLVQDFLGYGGTSNPDNLASYVGSGLTRDIVDILDEEKLIKVIAIGHDWGCQVISSLANWYPERILA